MPIYNFVCNECKSKFSEIVKIGETPKCPNCGSKDTKKRLSVEKTSFSLKGKGWYKDGY